MKLIPRLPNGQKERLTITGTTTYGRPPLKGPAAEAANWAVTVNCYDRTPENERFFRERMRRNLSLTDAAVALGLKAADVAALDIGAAELSPSDWARAFDLLAAAEGLAWR